MMPKLCHGCLGSFVEDEFVHIYSAALSGHSLGSQVNSCGTCLSVRLNPTGANAISPSAASLYESGIG